MKNKIFIAIDTNSKRKARSIISQSKIKNFKIGYKFWLEFLNSKNGRNFISTLKKKILHSAGSWVLRGCSAGKLF